MISKIVAYIRWLPLNILWFWAYSGFTKNLPHTIRLKRLQKIHAPNGPKQIIMSQIAVSLWRVGQNDQALAMFQKARDSELSWGRRKNKNVSQYIILYSEYCSKLIQFGAHHEPDQDLIDDFQHLKSLPTPESIKSYKMPLPASPNGYLM